MPSSLPIMWKFRVTVSLHGEVIEQKDFDNQVTADDYADDQDRKFRRANINGGTDVRPVQVQ